MRNVVAGLILIALSVPLAPTRAEPAGIACDAPAELAVPPRPLDHLAAAIAASHPINILAIGSATTVGSEAGSTHGTSFPYRMIEALQATLPKATFNLVVRGGRGLTAEAMLPLLQDDLKERRSQLVLWQTGTVEAVRGLRTDGLRGALEAGAEAVRNGGGDLILIDPQFSRFLRANTDLDTYENVLEQEATLPGVVLFHRFNLMRGWAMDGVIDMERAKSTDREKAVVTLNKCLGQALARFVLSGAGHTPR